MGILSVASIGAVTLTYQIYMIAAIINPIIIMHVWLFLGKGLAALLQSERQRFLLNVSLGVALAVTATFLIDIDLIKSIFNIT